MPKPTENHLKGLAALCGALAVIVLSASLLGSAAAPQELAAATALGDAQGVPPGHTGQTYPDDTACHVVTDGRYPYNTSPGCRAAPETFYSAILSAGSAATGQSAYLTSTYHYPYDVQDRNLGPATANCSISDSSVENCAVNGGSIYYTCSYAVPPGDSSVQMDYASPPNCWAYKTMPATVTSAASSAGSAPSVSPNGALTLAWSCLPSRTELIDSCLYNQFDSHCNAREGTQYSVNPLASGSTGSGPGFSTGGTLTGSQTIAAPATPGTYAYSVQCTGGSYTLPAMSIQVTVTDPCPVIADQPWSAGIFSVLPGQTRKIVGTSTFCVTNGPNSIVVPAATAAEVSAFKANAANVQANVY